MTQFIPKSIKQFYVSLFNWLASWSAPEDFNDVLILRLDELGDFVLWLDSAKEYRKIFYPKRITLLVNKKWYDLAKSLPYWDEVIGLDTFLFKVNPFYRLTWLRFIRKWGFETVVCPRWTIKFTLEPAIVAVSGATQKIVYEGNYPTEKQNYWTKLIPCRHRVVLHELHRNADFVKGLGLKDFKSSIPKLNIPCDKTGAIVVCPKSYRKRKEWDKYPELIKLLKDHPLHIIEKELELMNFIKYIAEARLVISNDSAPIHLAAALDVPSICIGVESFGRFMPYTFEVPREGFVLPRLVQQYRKMDDITVDAVWEVVKEII